MEHQNCPYLGLKEDPDTHLGFPSGGNICLRTSTATSISNHHQSDYCLTARHSSCPIYLHNTGLHPTAIPDRQTGSSLFKYLRVIFPVTLIAVMILLVPVILKASSLWVSISTSEAKSSDSSFSTNNGLNSAGVTNLKHTNVITTGISNEGQILTMPDTCPPPEIWVYYFIQPEDDLLRIVEENKITIEELLRVNCMVDVDQLKPGTMIYLPQLSTAETGANIVTQESTPTITMTATSTISPSPTPTSTTTPANNPITNPTNPPSPQPPKPTKAAPVDRPTPTTQVPPSRP